MAKGAEAARSEGRSPQGERGLKYHLGGDHGCRCRRRSPQGERGLKSEQRGHVRHAASSLPARGAWIEITSSLRKPTTPAWSLPARGAWIEIVAGFVLGSRSPGRSPQGERGLKYGRGAHGQRLQRSLPARGAWIEIVLFCLVPRKVPRRSPQGERGLKCVAVGEVRVG